MSTVHNSWIVFEESVIPENAGDTQRLEMKKSFYGGAAAMLSSLIILGDSNLAVEECVKTLQYAQSEIKEFIEEQNKNGN